MNAQSKERFVLAFISIFVFTTVVTASSFVTSATARTPVSVIAQSQSYMTSDEQQIVKAVLLNNQPNSPKEAPAQANKIVIANSYALASVLVGEHGGGMAVLSKKQGIWQVIGGGGGWLALNDLVKLGIPRSSAQKLLERIDPNWRSYEPQ